MDILPQSFYNRSSLEVAKDLIGKVLVGRDGTSGIIIETEAYRQDDPASHAYGGVRKRNEAMYGPPGHAYLYFIYGMYWCFNCVCEETGIGSGVLIRSLIPLDGIELMQQRRKQDSVYNLCSGPGKITQALNIRPSDIKRPLYLPKSEIKVCANEGFDQPVVIGKRIGISKAVDNLWRFGIKDSKYLSKPFN